jgi:hypothetical protein
LSLLLSQRRDEPLHLLLERLVVFLALLGADVSARVEYVPVFADVIERRGLLRARNQRQTGIWVE